MSAMASKLAGFESSWLQRVGILQREMYKTCITDLDELKQQPKMEWTKLHHVVTASVASSISADHCCMFFTR